MDSGKMSALLLISVLYMSSVTSILGCDFCGNLKQHETHIPSTKPTPTLPIRRPVPVGPVTIPAVLSHLPKGKAYPPPPTPKQATCPADTLKLGACVDLLGRLVHIGLGEPVMNRCCPVLKGLAELEAAACLCTTLKLKLLNLNFYVPLALQLLVTCGKAPPPGYTCTL